MTSEVVVMNRAGVALAADSAVTVEEGDGTKVRESAVKLFMLSKYRPVGVMVYNNAELLGVPWETLIKVFRREVLGRRAFDTLAEYGEELIRFLDGNARFFPDAVQNRYFLKALETECVRIGELVENDFVDRGLYGTTSQFPEVVERVIAERLDLWGVQEEAGYFKEVRAADVVGRISGEINQIIRRAAARWSVGSSGVVDNLYEIARHLVAKDYFPPDIFSGLVIAGFGEDEHFPGVLDLHIGGIYGGRLKVRHDEDRLIRVTEENPSSLMAFAYTDMVEAFLDGISPIVRERVEDATTYIREMPLRALDAVEGLSPEERRKRPRQLVRRAERRRRNLRSSCCRTPTTEIKRSHVLSKH